MGWSVCEKHDEPSHNGCPKCNACVACGAEDARVELPRPAGEEPRMVCDTSCAYDLGRREGLGPEHTLEMFSRGGGTPVMVSIDGAKPEPLDPPAGSE